MKLEIINGNVALIAENIAEGAKLLYLSDRNKKSSPTSNASTEKKPYKKRKAFYATKHCPLPGCGWTGKVLGIHTSKAHKKKGYLSLASLSNK